jgi:transposase
MKRLVIVPHFSDESLKEIMNTQSDVRSFKDWQIIYFLQTNPRKQIKEIAQMLCVSRSKILRSVQLYNQFGESWRPCGQLGGRRESRCHLSLADEKLLMQSLEDDALAGKILTFKHIKHHVERRVGKEVSDDYIWDLFSRHGWKKKVPRPYHPKADKQA